MLVLSRKVGETIQISDNISVTVTDVRGGRVRLSINAPKWVRVVRQEILLDDPGTSETPRLEANAEEAARN